MIDVNKYTTSKKLEDSTFVPLLDPETGAEVKTETGAKVGMELYSMHSKQFKRAIRSTAHLGLDKKEIERQKAIDAKLAEGISVSEEENEFLEHCEEKTIRRFQYAYAKVTTKLHNIELPSEFADEHDIALTGKGFVRETVDNIHKLYIALPDLTKQIGDAISDKNVFTKA